MNPLIFLLPVIDMLIISFAKQTWPSICVLFVLWRLCKNSPIILALGLQTIFLSMTHINLIQLFTIIILEILAAIFSKKVFSSLLIYSFLTTIYWFISAISCGANYLSGLLLILLFMNIWYNENRGRLDNRFA